MSKNWREKLTYANVTSTIALALALGGGAAYALNIRSSDIVNGQVKSVDIANKNVSGNDIKAGSLSSAQVKNASLKGIDVLNSSLSSLDIEDESLTTFDVADNMLTGADIIDLTGADVQDGMLESQDIGTGEINAGHLDNSIWTPMLSRINDLGGAGTVYGSPVGTSQADGTKTDVSMNFPNTTEVSRISVTLPAALPAGTSRTFTLDGNQPSDVSCTISAGLTACADAGLAQFNSAPPIAIKVVSTGAGLVANEDATVGLQHIP